VFRLIAFTHLVSSSAKTGRARCPSRLSSTTISRFASPGVSTPPARTRVRVTPFDGTATQTLHTLTPMSAQSLPTSPRTSSFTRFKSPSVRSQRFKSSRLTIPSSFSHPPTSMGATRLSPSLACFRPIIKSSFNLMVPIFQTLSLRLQILLLLPHIIMSLMMMITRATYLCTLFVLTRQNSNRLEPSTLADSTLPG